MLVRLHTLNREQLVPTSLEQTFAFFADPKNLNAITPQWLQFRILSSPTELSQGCLIHYRLRWHGAPLEWIAEIQNWRPPEEFEDVQLRGPYLLWHHRHEFQPVAGGTLVRDTVQYSLPFGAIGELVNKTMVRKDLERIFDYRVRQIAERLP